MPSERQPVPLIQMELREFAEFLIGRLTDEKLNPISQQLTSLSGEVRELKDAVLGNGKPALQQQIDELKTWKSQHDGSARLWSRLSTAIVAFAASAFGSTVLIALTYLFKSK